MIALLIPAAAVVALVLSERGSERASAHRAVGASAEYATPLAALGACLASGQRPPTSLVQWAIAEAQALGRADVATVLYQRFLLPLVQQGQASPAPAMPATPSGVSPSPAPSSPAPAATMQPELGAVAIAPNDPSVDPSAFIVRSPIAGVSDPAWAVFTERLAQDSPAFTSERRVGRFHSSRTRLAELGLDADDLIGNAHAQEQALAMDLADGFANAQAKGMLGAVGSSIAVPGCDAPCAVTLSGLLGVMSVGGMRGLHGWLTNAEDRQRFAFTTNTFLRTNGVF